MVYYRLLKTRWGILSYLAGDDKLIRLILPSRLPDSPEINSLRDESLQRQNLEKYCLTKKVEAAENKKLLPTLAEELDDYFAGKNVIFMTKYDLSDLSDFSRAVLEATRQIPYGETRSYGEIARDIHKPRAFRAVARALASNPIPIVIPCHRVINSDGNLGGYSGSCGPKFKAALLTMEQCLPIFSGSHIGRHPPA